jgi:hypothetical protein
VTLCSYYLFGTSVEGAGGNRAYAREIDRSWRLGRTEPRRISERAARCFGRATKKEIQFVVFC